MASTTAFSETEAVEAKVSDLKEKLAKELPDSVPGPLLEWHLPNRGRRHHKHDLMLFLSSGERVLLAEMKGPSTSRSVPDESPWSTVFDIVTRLLRSSLATEMSMERARDDLSPSEAAALQRGGVDLQATSPDTETVAASLGEWHKLVQTSYTTAQAAKLMRVKDSRIRQRLGGPRPSLFGFRHGKTWLIPRFQIEDRQVVRGLDLVVNQIDPSLHPVSVARWFQTPNPDLVNPTDDERLMSPIDWLRTGGAPETAAELAATL
jgi:hypothetical protein